MQYFKFLLHFSDNAATDYEDLFLIVPYLYLVFSNLLFVERNKKLCIKYPYFFQEELRSYLRMLNLFRQG